MDRQVPLLLRLQSDARLAELARNRQPLAFAALAERYQAELLRTARRLGAGGESEDVVQQTLLAAWRALAGGATVRKPRPWLHTIMRHKLADQLAHRGADQPLTEAAAVGGSVEELAEQRLRLAAALEAVAALPAKQRQALQASELEGRSRQELAALLGLSEAAVRGLIARARATVRAAATIITPLVIARRLAGEPLSAQAATAFQLPGQTALTVSAAAPAAATVAKIAAATVIAGGIAATIGLSDHRPNRSSHPTVTQPAPIQTTKPPAPRPPAAVGLNKPRTPVSNQPRPSVGAPHTPAPAPPQMAGRKQVGQTTPPPAQPPPAAQPPKPLPQTVATRSRRERDQADQTTETRTEQATQTTADSGEGEADQPSSETTTTTSSTGE